MRSLLPRTPDPGDPDPGPPPAGLWGFLWHYARQGRVLILASVLVHAASVAIFALGPLLWQGVVDHAIAGRHEDAARAALLAVGLLLVAFAVLERLSGVLYSALLSPRLREAARVQMARRLRAQSLSFFAGDFAGRLATRVERASFAVVETFYIAGLAVVGICVNFAVSAAVLASLSAAMAALFAAWAAAYLLVLLLGVPRLRTPWTRASAARSKVTGTIVDGFSNIQTVKLFGRDAHEDARLAADARRAAALTSRAALLKEGLWATLNVLALAFGGAILWTALARIADGSLPPSALVVVVGLLPITLNWMTWMANQAGALMLVLSDAQDAAGPIAATPAIQDAPGAPALARPADGAAVAFEAATFRYGTGHGGVRDLTLHIPAGQKVGIVGRSGAGKSTLVGLLLRLHDVEAGRVLVAGQDVRDVAQDSLRQAVATVSQETGLLHRSVADNIRYARPDASDADVEAAARRAHAHEFIVGLRDPDGRHGYAAHVGERGVRLSGGQRQRVAIARALLDPAPILVLDEATSALDSESEAFVQDELDALMEGRTVLVVAHRLSTLQRMDRIVVLDHGRVAEDGTHDALLAQGGIYADLWRRQSGGLLGDGHRPQA